MRGGAFREAWEEEGVRNSDVFAAIVDACMFVIISLRTGGGGGGGADHEQGGRP
jgi:hypothetical protein